MRASRIPPQLACLSLPTEQCRQQVLRPPPQASIAWDSSAEFTCLTPCLSPAAAVAGPPGAAELARALHMLAPQAARYDAWRQGARVMAVGGCTAEEEQLGYMTSLLDSIPQVSAPAGWRDITVLHPGEPC